MRLLSVPARAIRSLPNNVVETATTTLSGIHILSYCSSLRLRFGPRLHSLMAEANGTATDTREQRFSNKGELNELHRQVR